MSMKKKGKGFSYAIFLCLALNTSLVLAQGRDSWQQPERVMNVIGIKPGMTIGEVGAGKGYFTFKMARRVGSEGRVYANDIDQEALKNIADQCRSEGITNITTILGKVDDPLFPEGAMDLAFMSFVFHMLEKPVEILRNITPSLKPGATLVILEADPKKRWMGPFPENKKIGELAAEAGYELIRIETFLDRANIYIFRQKQ